MEWAPESGWKFWKKKSLAPTGIRFPDRLVSSLLPTTGPLNPSVAGNTLTTTQYSAARGDIWSEKVLQSFLCHSRDTRRSNFCKTVSYLWRHRITSSYGTNSNTLCYVANFVFYKSQWKGKAIPLQAWTGPEGSRRLRFPDFKTIGTWKW